MFEEGQKLLKERKDTQQTKKEKYVVLNSQKMHYNKLEQIFHKSSLVSRVIRRFFPSKKEFEKYVAETLNTTEEKLKSQTVSVNDIKQTCLNIFDNFDTGLGKREIEGFLSAFTYN